MAERDNGTGQKEEKEDCRRAGAHAGEGTARGAVSGTDSGLERKGSRSMSVGKSVLMITQIGVSMLTPIFVGGLIGYWLDRLTGAGFLFLVFLLFGFLAAFRNVYRLTKPFYAEDLRREEQEAAYWKELQKERAKNRAAAAAQARDSELGAQPSGTGQEQNMEPGSPLSGTAQWQNPDSGMMPFAAAPNQEMKSGSSGAAIPQEISGVRARRLRAQLAEQRSEAGPVKEMPKDRRQEAEEEFNAWRKRNRGE